MRGFGRQNHPTPFEDLDPAHSTGPTAAAGGTDKNLGVAQRPEQLAADRSLDRFLVVDCDRDIATGHQFRARTQNEDSQNEDDPGEKTDSQYDLDHTRPLVRLRVEFRKRP